jgi:hypothetical protein
MNNLSLYRCEGTHVPAPNAADLAQALTEVLHRGDRSDDDHPNAWLTLFTDLPGRCATLTVDIYTSGLAILTKLEDQDDDEPVLELRVHGVDLATAQAAWTLLARGDEASLIALFRAHESLQ